MEVSITPLELMEVSISLVDVLDTSISTEEMKEKSIKSKEISIETSLWMGEVRRLRSTPGKYLLVDGDSEKKRKNYEWMTGN